MNVYYRDQLNTPRFVELARITHLAWYGWPGIPARRLSRARAIRRTGDEWGRLCHNLPLRKQWLDARWTFTCAEWKAIRKKERRARRRGTCL